MCFTNDVYHIFLMFKPKFMSFYACMAPTIGQGKGREAQLQSANDKLVNRTKQLDAQLLSARASMGGGGAGQVTSQSMPPRRRMVKNLIQANGGPRHLNQGCHG